MDCLFLYGSVLGVVQKEKKTRQFKDRRAPCEMLFSSSQGLLSL